MPTLPGPAKTHALVRRWRTLRWIFRPLDALTLRARLYGDDFRVSPPDRSPVVAYFSSPEALATIFAAKPDQLSAGAGNALLKPLLGEHGIVLLQGQAHQRHRQLLMPPFHGDRMRSYGDTILAIARQGSDTWPVGKPIAVRPAMQEISLRVILTTVFGLHEGERYTQLRQGLSDMLDGLGSPLGFMMLLYRSWQRDWGDRSPWGHFLRQRQHIDQLLFAEIQERWSTAYQSQTDILALLLAARDEQGQPLTDIELRDELLTLLFAGHETTATALSWALYWILSLSQVKETLVAEIHRLGQPADPGAIAKLPYLTAVCQETLRLYPVAMNGFPRNVLQPMEIAGYPLERGSVVIPAIYLAHHRPQVYPEPQQFRPERFLEQQFSPYEYLPFGGGDRRCIGAAFALYEIKLVLFSLLSRFDLALATNQPVRPVRRGVTIAPSRSLGLRIK